jgi:hypothetical protein
MKRIIRESGPIVNGNNPHKKVLTARQDMCWHRQAVPEDQRFVNGNIAQKKVLTATSALW